MKPTTKPAPVSSGGAKVRPIGDIHKQALPIFVSETVLETILDYSHRDLTRELGGFMLGGLFEDRNREYIEVRNYLPAVDARSRAASLTFTHDTWSAMTRQAEEQFPDDRVVGWHHTHPGFGIFLSGYDLFIHRNFFGMPWQIAMVVDPKRQEFGFFQWRAEEIVDCGFLCVQQSKAAAT